MPHPVLDQPEALRGIFHPRPGYALIPSAAGVHPVPVEVEPGITVGARLYTAEPEAPAILYWHGNGEIAADYDGIAPMYTRLGITLLVADYRGYGRSDGTPSCSSLLTDAVTVFEAVGPAFQDHGLAPSRIYVMGRSLGSAAAIEVAVHAGEQLAGLIIESGFADTFALLGRLAVPLEGATEDQDCFGNATKIGRVTIPTLIIHGQDDPLIPATDGQELYRRSAAGHKQLVLVPGAGHNDLMLVKRDEYFRAIHRFVQAPSGG
ncbi:MAG: alpha/beta hydrolase [Chloroflexi bacterium B3_Chlor]|nr:MAG: alpha/beta hydrolase [Chloroflexi bacterium B3_Chlor]